MDSLTRLAMLRAMNPKFADAEARGEKWAVQHGEMVRGIDGQASRQYPERTPREDGKPRNWCGDCLHPEGCVTCDLSAMPVGRRKQIGAYKTK
jgi:hypothetical protein